MKNETNLNVMSDFFRLCVCREISLPVIEPGLLLAQILTLLCNKMVCMPFNTQKTTTDLCDAAVQANKDHTSKLSMIEILLYNCCV